MKNDVGLRISDNSFMGRWYPEPFEFMPCRTAQHTPKWGRHVVGCRERVKRKPCTLHTRVSPATSADERSRPSDMHEALVLVCPRCEYKDAYTRVWLAHTSHVVYADNAPPTRLPNCLRSAATVRLTAEA